MKTIFQLTKRMVSVYLAILLGLFCGCSPQGSAPALPANTWTSLGPDGGDVWALEIDPQEPSNLYAAVGSGIYKSMDAGESWSPAGTGLETPVYSISIDPVNPQMVYAGGKGIYKTVNGGTSWQLLLQVPSPYVLLAGPALDPQIPGTLYTGAWSVVKSSDGGETWATTELGTEYSDTKHFFVDPHNSHIVYASMQRNMYRSYDSGASWHPVNGLEDASIDDLAFDPAQPATVYATSSCNLFKSTNWGVNWSVVALPPMAQVISDIEIDPQDPSNLYVGVIGGILKGEDGGNSWSWYEIVNGQYTKTIAIDPRKPTTLYVGLNDSGVYKSLDGGVTWSAANKGLSASEIKMLAFDHQKPVGFYAFSPTASLVKSLDGGNTWIPAAQGLPQGDVSVLAAGWKKNSPIYAGVDGKGLYKSMDGGSTWTATGKIVDPPKDCVDQPVFHALAIDPTDLLTLYVGLQGYGIYKSLDGGESWKPMNTGLTTLDGSALVIDPQTSDTLYTGTGFGVFKSTDGALTWSLSGDASTLKCPLWNSDGTCSGLANPDLILALAIDPETPSKIYALGFGGLYKSSNGGQTWVGISPKTSSSSLEGLVVDPHNPAVLYVGAWGDGVYKSNDRGATWSKLPVALISTNVQVLALDPLHPDILFAGTENAGVVAIDQEDK